MPLLAVCQITPDRIHLTNWVGQITYDRVLMARQITLKFRLLRCQIVPHTVSTEVSYCQMLV